MKPAAKALIESGEIAGDDMISMAPVAASIGRSAIKPDP
jgi:hypothetical protein